MFRIFRKTVDGEDEDWVEFMHRATRTIENLSTQLGMKCWVETQKRRKWQFAGRLVRCKDDRWSHVLVNWKPHDGFGRFQGHPVTRWTDQLEQFAGGGWQEVAEDEKKWNLMEEGFVTHDV